MRDTIFEALPGLSRRRRPARMSIGDPPGGADEFLAGGPEFAAPRRSPLPRILRGVRVLVVDDDPDTADLFATALAACGADVVTTLAAREALSFLTARPPDAAVTDIAMPGADGYWLVREIQGLADARARALPAVAVTAFGREHSRARALAAGFVDHLNAATGFTTAAVQAKTRSAVGFHDVMTPSSVLLTMTSSDDSTMAASRAR